MPETAGRGKILKGIAGFYYVQSESGRVYACRARGLFRLENVKPLPGDDVLFEITDEKDGEGAVTEILPRRNTLIRPAVANVDRVLLVFSVLRPDPNFNLIDRLLLTIRRQDVEPALLFNKTDLDDGSLQRELSAIYRDAGLPVLFFSTKTGEGTEEIGRLIEGGTSVLSGPSGVGKSSLLNHFCPHGKMETGEISRKLHKGKNTTRHSELFTVRPGTYLIDTPGYTYLFAEGIEPEELKDFYPEFAAYAPHCRFDNCVHIGETDCAVKRAVEDGRIHPRRYENYVFLFRELKDRKKY